MGQIGRAALKAYFETGDVPTEAEFIDLMDSVHNITDDGIIKQSIGATNAFPFNALETEIAAITISGATEFSVNETGAASGNTTYREVTADGTNIPTFTANFRKSKSSRTYDNTAGVVNILGSWFTGTYYIYTWIQMEATSAPTMSSRTIEDANPTDIVMVFSEVVTGTNLGFTINGTTSSAFASISGSGTNTITGTMADAAVFGETITLDYSSVTGDIINGTSDPLATFSGAAVTNNVADATAPTMTSATIEDASDDVLDFVFSDAVTITTAGWNIDTDGAALSISSVLSGSGTTTPKFQLSRSILSTETLNVDYNSATGATVKVSNSVELVTFTDTAVTNNVAGSFAPGDVLNMFFEGDDAGNFTISDSDQIDAWLKEGAEGANALGTTTRRPQFDTDHAAFNVANTEELIINDITDFDADSQGEIVLVCDNFDATATRTLFSFGGIDARYITIRTTNTEKIDLLVRSAVQDEVATDNTFNDILGTTGDNKKLMITCSANGSRFKITINNADQAITVFNGTDSGNWLNGLGSTLTKAVIGALLNNVTTSSHYDHKLFFVGYASTELTTQQRTDLFNYLDGVYTIPGSA